MLFQPEIPPNTGNIIRLCANAHCNLHLIEPLGFDLTDKHLKRAGLDYILPKSLQRYASFEAYLQKHHEYQQNDLSNIYLCSTKAKTLYTEVGFKPGDSFVFGPETRGLPADLLDQYPENQKITIPMHASSRSLNLSNAVAVIVYEAWRQNEFRTAPPRDESMSDI